MKKFLLFSLVFAICSMGSMMAQNTVDKAAKVAVKKECCDKQCKKDCKQACKEMKQDCKCTA